jgi:hypothetical protein
MAKKKKVPGYTDFLKADTTYQSQMAQLRKAYSSYVAAQGNQRTNFGNTYALNKKNLRTERTRGLVDTTDDYASRGMLQSGLYGKQYADRQTDYSQRQAALDTERSAFLSDLGVNLATFKGEQETVKTSAKQEAIARRAAKYNLRV